MPNLPTLEVDDEQAARCLAVFGSPAAYLVRLADWVRGEVLKAELGVLTERQDIEQAELVADITENVLPGS